MNYIPPKLAMISNLTGYGRCSLAVAIPVVSALKVQACPVPTGLYSNHLAFPTWSHLDLTNNMQDYLEGFAKLNLTFDGIYYGFPGNEKQIAVTEAFFQSQSGAKILLDPAMGDHGKMYSSLTDAHCQGLKRLMKYAHIVTPNVTEACFLTGETYSEEGWNEERLGIIAEKLHALGPSNVVITGVREKDCYMNFVSENSKGQILTSPIKGKPYHGTGDLFAAVMAADMLRDVPLETSVKKASAFVGACIEVSELAGASEKDGVLFENCLSMLM